MNNIYEAAFPPLPLVTHAKSRSISAENPDGKTGFGGQAASNLGKGRKGRPCINLPENKEFTIMDIDGEGMIKSIWFTLGGNEPFVLRDVILKMYWDGEGTPSVEVPIGDFFCCGFSAYAKRVNSQFVCVNPTGGLNCYFPMPFKKHAKIVIDNQHDEEVGLFYQINYELLDIPDDFGYFHAQWRRTNGSSKPAEDHVILDGIEGSGLYIGTYIGWAALSRYWWGEGEVKFYIDDDERYPTICGTGTEDYFCGAWCFYEKNKDGYFEEQLFNTNYVGYVFNSHEEFTRNDFFSKDAVPMHGLYRWHSVDPVRFEKGLKVIVQQMGYNGRKHFERADDVSSVAYWYQKEPHAAFPALPEKEQRWPR